MIFRRPDAFIIKHIKFFHAIILFCLAYLLFKISNLSTFYEYVASAKSIIGESNIPDLFDIYMFVASALSVIIVIIIMLILIKKEKKYLFYAISTGIFIAIFVFLIMSYSNINTMQKNDVSATVYLAYKDLAKIIFYVLSVSVFLFLFKATGFDFKTFKIGQNVSGLDFTDADSEEVELNFEIDSNEIKTKRRKQIRELKYLYFENRFKINLVIFLVICLFGFSIYKSLESKKEIYYSLDDELRTSKYTLKIEDIYITDQDYKGNKIKKDGVFAILMFKVKKNSEAEATFDTSNISLLINEKQYYVNNKNVEYFIDFGNAYKEQKLSLDYEDYFLLFEIPYEFSTEEIFVLTNSIFNYKINRYNVYKTKVNYKRISDKETSRSYYLNDEMEINVYGINTKIKINNVDIQTKYKLTHDKVVNDKNYQLVEYLVPTASDNEEKAIMKITCPEENKKLQAMIPKYASIEYKIDGILKEGKIYSFINPTLVKENNVYYVQVSKEFLKGEERVIKFKMHDQVYRYSID